MQLSDFDFTLPPGAIAQKPATRRTGSKLLVLNKNGSIADHCFTDLPDFIRPDDLVIFNNTKVIPARVIGKKKPDGGKIELFLERILDGESALAQIGTNKRVKIGQKFEAGSVQGTIVQRKGAFFQIRFHGVSALDVFRSQGAMPLPPYIDRSADEFDKERYQTVFAESEGAVAAPTAGLHFDQELIDKIKSKEAQTGLLTLHVGAGTFQPMRVETVEDHRMHFERFSVSIKLSDQIKAVRKAGGRIIAVGTTVARTLESVAIKNGCVTPQEGETDIFIYPGFEFKVVDALVTNFHLPKSSLLLMVSAFSGKPEVLNAYQHAINNDYRFYSYGDAMLLSRRV
ncbi:MAG: S-adenosylmethionine:tRNA ribosyltransferase-isomerase [Parasphingorhabdus sp.]|jgi:S-adenosylmethionine:tRNA ribosyltransferase-isomerase